MIDSVKRFFKNKFFRCDCIEDKKKIEEEWEHYKNQKAILIDVRSIQEFNEGHIEGAICIPYYELYKRIELETEGKEQMIILYCNTGSRSKKAAHILRKLGYKNIDEVCKRT